MTEQCEFDFGKPRTTADAVKLLINRHGDKIERARVRAIELCRETGSVTSKTLTSTLRREGLVEELDRCYWVGCVFRDKRFSWTGEYKTYADPARNVHERTIKIWTLSYE